jgi:hypothetical protein
MGDVELEVVVEGCLAQQSVRCLWLAFSLSPPRAGLLVLLEPPAQRLGGFARRRRR